MPHRIFSSVLLLCLTASPTLAQDRPAFSAADLLRPEMLPNASYGMRVEEATDGATARVVTTGAEFLIDTAAGTIECRQRIPRARSVATLKLAPRALAGLKLAHRSSGAAIFAGNGTTLRINGDSLLQLAPNRDGDLTATLKFTPDYHKEFRGNYNFFDPEGGISFYENGHCPRSTLRAAADPVTVTWPWKRGDVFWAGVSPPKPYDWDAALRNRVVRQGSSEDRFIYPSDLQLARWSRGGYGKIVFLHCEPMWRHWQLELVPRDLESFRRVIKTAHEEGMKVVPYASPHFFIKGTSMEGRAHPDPHHGPGQFVGSNARLYLEQATRIVKEFGADGLYFDEIYGSRESLATQYWLSRSSRELVGDTGILELHSTTDVLNDGHTGAYCPTLHTYFDIVLKGEGEYDRIEPGYLRYYLSTYNISNATAAAEWFDRVPTPEMIDRLLRVNVHFHLPEHWFYTGSVEVLRRHYWPRLTPALERSIREDLSRRTGVFEQFRRSIEGGDGKEKLQRPLR